jgi:hypothetical protein
MSIITSIKTFFVQRKINNLSEKINRADQWIALHTEMRDVLSDIRTEGNNPLIDSATLIAIYTRLLNKQRDGSINELEAELLQWVRLDYLQNYDEF